MRRLGLAVTTLVTALLATFGVLAAPAAQACACGGFVAEDGESVAARAEYAVLTWDGTTERVLLSMDALTESADAALLIPTPGPAEASLAEETVFSELDSLTAPEEVVEYQWWPDFGLAGSASDGAPGATATGVSVLDVRQLGDLEVTVLSASDADELADWLEGHEYVMRDGLADALMPYVSEGWYYIAIRLTTDAENLSGSLQPLDLTFESEQLIYPMRLSAAATSDQFVRTFVFSDHKVERTDETAEAGALDLRFAGEVSPTAVSTQALVEIASERPYLTVIDQYFDAPGEQVVSDFTFAQAPSDRPFRETEYSMRMREVLGMPAGPALTFVGATASPNASTSSSRGPRRGVCGQR